jgi:hypothetical protein
MVHLGNDGADAALGQIHAERQTDRAAAHDEHLRFDLVSHGVLIAQFDAFAYALWEKATAFGGLNPRRDAEGARRSRPPI